MSENAVIPRRKFLTRVLLRAMGAGAGVLLLRAGIARSDEGGDGGGFGDDYDWTKHTWSYAIDTNKCIGCCACMRACKAENDVPDGYARTWIERYHVMPNGEARVDLPEGPDFVFKEREGEEEEPARSFFVPKICNHCEKSVCTQVCPVGASYMTEDGVVLVDNARCIGCGYCVQACPYGTRFINPNTHHADKCTLCYHRITRGLPTACVAACPTGARTFGDVKDPKSHLSVLLRQQRFRVLRPEMGTHPKCYYLGLDREVI